MPNPNPPTPFHRPIKSSDLILSKPLPHNLEMERCVLGAILLDNSAITAALEYLKPTDFFRPEHQKLFRHMVNLSELGHPIDTAILFEKLSASGELEAAGGAGYLSTIADGLPRVNNVAFYARIVLEKSSLRSLIFSAHGIAERALEGNANPDELLAEYVSLPRTLLSGRAAKLITVDIESFLTMSIAPLDYVVEPLLSIRGRGMVYAPRGAGKTYFCLELAYAIATGTNAFAWKIPAARRVRYVEGEMDGAMLQNRLRHLVMKIHGGKIPEPGFLKISAMGLPEQKVRPKINTPEGRGMINDLVDSGDVLILDNLTALSPSSDEDETADWAEIQEWLIDLSFQGVSTIFVHHAGKSGEQRGTSKREDLLDFVLSLKLPSDYMREEGMRAEIYITKMRGRSILPEYAAPFEVKLEEDCWTTRPLLKVMRDRAIDMLSSGMHPRDIAQDTGLSRYQVYRLQKEQKGKLPPS